MLQSKSRKVIVILHAVVWCFVLLNSAFVAVCDKPNHNYNVPSSSSSSSSSSLPLSKQQDRTLLKQLQEKILRPRNLLKDLINHKRNNNRQNNKSRNSSDHDKKNKWNTFFQYKDTKNADEKTINNDKDSDGDNSTNSTSQNPNLIMVPMPILPPSETSDNDKTKNNDNKKMIVPSFTLTGILQSLEPYFNTAVSLVQYVSLGIIVVQVFKAVKDLSNDVISALNESGHGLINEAQLEVLITHISREILLNTSSDYPSNNAGDVTKVPALAIRLATQLLASGLPLTSSSRPSVASILIKLNTEEAQLLSSTIVAKSTKDSIDRVAGLHHVKISMKKYIQQQQSQQHGNITPSRLTGFEAFVKNSSPFVLSSSSDGKVSGMLLYGPPGCGKSLLIRSMAADLKGQPTLVITPSTIMRKWYGDSNLRVRSLFTLLPKIAPCMVVLDELDGIFRERGVDEHEVTRGVKTEFLQWWDGLLSNGDTTETITTTTESSLPIGTQIGSSSSTPIKRDVLIIGATNRPFDLDPAVLRRFPQRFYINLPCVRGRKELIRNWIQEYQLPIHPGYDKETDQDVVQTLADSTDGFTPSDLRQVLERAISGGPLSSERQDNKLMEEDVVKALFRFTPTKFPIAYMNKLQAFEAGGYSSNNNGNWKGHFDQDYNSQQGYYQQQQQRNKFYSNPSLYWESDHGNFYHLGHLQVDPDTLQGLVNLFNLVVEVDDGDDDDDDDNDNDDYDSDFLDTDDDDTDDSDFY